MTSKKSKYKIKKYRKTKKISLILVAIVTFSATIACSKLPEFVAINSVKQTSASSTVATTFMCKFDDNQWGTFAQRLNQTAKNPLIIWNTKYFGDNYTPQKRCEIVSEKLTKAVANNGGNLTNLNLKAGEIIVNQAQYVVICVVSTHSDDCDSDNMLFTLKPENTKNPNEVLAKMVNFAMGNNLEYGNDLPSSVALNGLVDNVFLREAQIEFSLPVLPLISFATGLFGGGVIMFLLGKRSAIKEAKRLQKLLEEKENNWQQEVKLRQLAEAEVKRLQELLKTGGSKQQQEATLRQSAESEVKRLQELLEAKESNQKEETKLRQSAEAEVERLKESIQVEEKKRQQEVTLRQSVEAKVGRLQELLKVGDNKQRQEIELRQSAEAEVKRLQELLQVTETEMQALKLQQTQQISEQATSASSEKRDSEEVELASAKGIDYTHLRDLLAALKFQEADEETWRCMLEVAKQQESKYLQKKDIDNFPCEDLRTIDRLWVKYSNGRFGFSVQKQIYQKVDGTDKYSQQIWEAFSSRVGWRKGESKGNSLDSTLGKIDSELNNFFGGTPDTPGPLLEYANLTFGITAPHGHLPCAGCLRSGWDGWFAGGGEGFSFLMLRLTTCRIDASQD